MTVIMPCLSVSLGHHFRQGKCASQPHVEACVCLCSDRAWQGVLCRQLKLFINALLDNTPSNPIIWQAAIRAFAVCLSVCMGQIRYQQAGVKVSRGEAVKDYHYSDSAF